MAQAPRKISNSDTLSEVGVQAIGFGALGEEVVPVTAAAPLPVSITSGGTLSDASIASLTGSSQQLFPAAASASGRFIFNSGIEDVWFNPFGGDAEENGAGSILLEPGDGAFDLPANEINVIGVAGEPLTAGEM